MKQTSNLKNSKNLASFAVLLVAISNYSCKKMDSTYAHYLEGGEIVYVAKADSLKAVPGKNRLLLSWQSSSDPKVATAKIFWNNGELLKEHTVAKTSGKKTEDVIIEDISEGAYTFEVVTYDTKGNTSITVSVSATVYGERYLATLQTRRVRQAVYRSEDRSVLVDWYNAPLGAFDIEVSYQNNAGQTATVRTPAAEPRTILPDLKTQGEIKYRTRFLPEEHSIDTFYTPYVTIEPEFLLDKSKFRRWNNEHFPYTEYFMGAGFNIEKLWDGVYTGYGYVYLETEPLPRSFTFDLGQLASIYRIRLSPNWDAQLYNNGNIKKAEIWGSATADVTTDFSSWTYLGTLNSVKPSGLPVGQNTTEDLAYAQAGENFALVESPSPVRYIRFVVQDTWIGSISMHITELTFWGHVVEP